MEVFSRPADTYVAGFIGAPAMNFLPAALINDGAAVQLATGQVYPLKDRHRGQAVTLGIRPENVSLAAEGIPLEVELVEPLGSETLVHGRMTDGTALLAKLPGAAPVADVVIVALDPAALHLFDRASGGRIEPG